jgi:hypothetical protein
LSTVLTAAASGECVEGETPGDDGEPTGLSTGSNGGSTGTGGGDGPCDMGGDGPSVVTVDVEGAPGGGVVLIGGISLGRSNSWSPDILKPVCCEGEDCVVGGEPGGGSYGTENGGPVK